MMEQGKRMIHRQWKVTPGLKLSPDQQSQLASPHQQCRRILSHHQHPLTASQCQSLARRMRDTLIQGRMVSKADRGTNPTQGLELIFMMQPMHSKH